MAADKFTIIKGVDNEYTFTVKANNSLLPMPIATGSNTVVATTITEYPAADYVPPVTGTDAQLWKTRIYTDVSKLYNKPTYFGTAQLLLDTEYSATITVDLNLSGHSGTGTLVLTVDGISTSGVPIDLSVPSDSLLTAVKDQLVLGGNYMVNIHDSKIYISKKASAGGVLTVTGSNEFSIVNGAYPGILGIHYITANHLWIDTTVALAPVTKEWNGTAWAIPVVSVVVNGATRSVNFDYTIHNNKNTLLQALKAKIALDTSLVLTVEDDYIEVARNADFTVVEGMYTKSRVTQVGVTAVNGSAGGYRVRYSTHTVDTSILNRMNIPTSTVSLTTSLGSVVGTVTKTNGVFPSTVTVTGLSTTEYYTIPPQVVVTCSYTYSGTDSFTFTLRALTDTNTVVKTWGMGTGVTVVDSINGKVKLVVPAADTTALISLKGPAEHGYYLKPVYELRLEADTQYNGNFVASVGKVYVR